MRLIDAESFEKQVAAMAMKNNYKPQKAIALCELIKNQPTAYDVEKVVEQLETVKGIMTSPINQDCFGEECKASDCTVCLMCRAIEIVKGGGVK